MYISLVVLNEDSINHKNINKVKPIQKIKNRFIRYFGISENLNFINSYLL